MVGTCSIYSGEMRNANKILVGKPKGDGDIDERKIRILEM